MNDVRRIHHLRGLQDSDRRSLRLALLTAAHHFEKDEARAGWEALADALWSQHKGAHEQLSDREMIEAIRRLVGFLWNPESPEGEAA